MNQLRTVGIISTIFIFLFCSVSFAETARVISTKPSRTTTALISIFSSGGSWKRISANFEQSIDQVVGTAEGNLGFGSIS